VDETAFLSRMASVRHAIVGSFPLEPAPSPNDVTSHACFECEAIGEAFAGLRWNAVPRDLLHREYDALPLFTVRAHRYYLPAYLLDALVGDGAGCSIDFVIYDLAPKDGDGWQQRFAAFSRDQIAAVTAWLELVLQYPLRLQIDEREARRGYESYWKPRPRLGHTTECGDDPLPP
jgi:hypothetical protein